MVAWPTFIVEVMFGQAPGQTYLTFDDAARGKFNTGTFAPDGAWTDITTDVRSVSIRRGRQRQLDRFAAGSCTIVLDNNAGNYDPNNLAGPYVSAGVTQVQPMKAVRVRASWQGVTYPLWRGFVDSWVPAWAPGQKSDQWVTLSASDGFKVLAQYQSSAVAGVGAGDDTGTRVGRVLTNAGWPTTDRNLDAGDSTLQATTLGQSALDDCQIAVDSEYGRFYMDATGNVRFEHRTARQKVASTNGYSYQLLDNSSSLSSGLLETSPPPAVYESATVVFDDTLVRNSMFISNVGGTVQSPSDATSITNYLTRTYTRSDLILQTDTDALAYAQGLLSIFKNPEIRFEQVVLNPLAAMNDTNFVTTQAALSLDISNLVYMILTPKVGTSPLTQPSFIEGITHSINVGSLPWSWTTTFDLSSAAQYAGFMVFQPDAGLGVDYGTLSAFNTGKIGW